MTDESRVRAAQTTKEKHGVNFYSEIGSMSARFKDPELARLASLKRWHPERFDEDGNLKEETDV